MARRVNTAKAELFFEALRRGHTRREAAAIAGVSRTQAWRWLSDNETFRNRAEKAESGFADEMIDRIKRAAPRSWRAAAWLMEHRFEEWMPRGRLAVESLDTDMTAEERQILDSIRKREGMEPAELEADEAEFVLLAIDGCDDAERLREWGARIEKRLRLPAFSGTT